MQPFARPVARAVWGQARLSFDRPARPAKTFRQATALVQSCSPTRLPAIGARARFFSSQLPPKDVENKGPESKESKSKDTDPLENPKPTSSSSAKPDAEPNTEPRGKLFSSPAELPSTLESYRGNLNQRFSQMMDTFQARAMNASQALNDITGYSSIDSIKKRNSDLEVALAEAHERVRSARQAYKQANTKRAATQREVTTLLARKDTWSPSDLERFTQLYRTDHVLEGEVSGSQEALTEAEADEQSLSQRLNSGILNRYHEEQIWSDRIRRASTWGTWGLMGMNFLLFVVLQFVAEPWKRKRLVRGVVAEEKAVLDEVRNQLEELKSALDKKEFTAQAAVHPKVSTPPEDIQLLEEQPAAVPPEAPIQKPVVIPVEQAIAATPIDIPAASEVTWKEFLSDPARWRVVAEDLYSERRVDLRMKDVSLLALEGALAGAAVAGSVALLLVRRS